MKLSKYWYLVVLSVCLVVVAGCGEDKTIYDGVSPSTTTTGGTTTTTGGTTTTTGSTTTTTSGGGTTAGSSLYTTYCAGCHGAKASTTVNTKTVAAFQSAIAATTYGMNTTTLKALTTDQLTAISTYLSN